MTPRDAVLAVIKHQEVYPVPYSLPMEIDVERRMDEYYGNTEWKNKIIPYFRSVMAVDTNAMTKIDDSHVIDDYGGIWRVDIRPWHLEKVPLSEPSFAGYDFPKPEKFYRPDAKAIGIEDCKKYGNESFIFSSLGWGLFERSWNLRGFVNILTDFIDEPDFVNEALDKLCDLYLKFIEYNADLPADGILFGDDWGDQRGVIIGPERWREFLKPRWKRIFEATHATGKITMCHSCGSVADIIPDLIEIGLDVLESVQPEAANMNPLELKKLYGKDICFWGGIGSQSLLPFGTPTEITRTINNMKKEMAKGGGYLMAPAKPLQPETPTENAVAAFEAFVNN